MNERLTLASGDFSGGFSVGEAGSEWFYFALEPFVADGALATVSEGGLRAVADGTNPSTGEPAFTKTVPQEHASGGVPGALDRPKWFAYRNCLSSKGVPGFDVSDGMQITCEAWIGGRAYGIEAHPFGRSVTNPQDDLRLACWTLSMADFETMMLLDFVMTNERIYAFYERLAGASGNPATFSYALPVAPNAPGRTNHLSMTYDRSAGTVRWLVGGVEVFRVDRLGRRLDSREGMVLDNGGAEEDVILDQLDVGFGLLTFLDGYGPSGLGLVRLSDAPDFYFDPSVGEPTALEFFDDESRERNRLFGQGAELVVQRYAVSVSASPSAAI